ncbi:response regulator transcription factor [Kitasatospora sp. NBC_01539]|uniref:response regulator transcription factor n=1 Tax=Kitasatospora sp. NBC_01539 TaxID=2903577 RepID=UPI00386017E1
MNSPTRTVRVLTVEDDEAIRILVALTLSEAGFEVREAADGPSGVETARSWRPDVVVLDVNLPGFDGLETCRRIHAFSQSYVLMLSARSDEVDKLVGLATGADDYLTKPFSPRELAARVQALVRRSRPTYPAPPAPYAPYGTGTAAGAAGTPAGTAHVVGGLLVDVSRREARLDGTVLELTRTEFDLLLALAERPRHVVTRALLRERVWGDDLLADDHAVDVHVSNLRRKLRAVGAGGLLRTVRGVGYRLDPPATR